jgi:FkbH-like protein
VVSKNDDAEARRPFSERPEMLLSLDSLVRFDASWRPKYQGIAQLADQLNIGIDSVCFLDDSAKERDEARRMLPGLIVPELPESPARRVQHLVRSRLFTAPLVSAEDRLRVEFFKRAALPTPNDLDDYLAHLDMSLEAISVGPSTIDRVLSLLHKTNQFNLTLWRPTPAELATFLADGQNYAYSFRLTDRLGDAGIIAVLLAAADRDRARIAAWVMSCRVFTRGVEWAVIDHLSGWMDKHGLSTIDAPYAEGPRNGLVGDVLRDVGLRAVRTEDRVTWFSAEDLTPPRHHITIVNR